jgi:diguanylate cyclase (GGDEF)-like protein/PAS domain S-box-containing protein
MLDAEASVPEEYEALLQFLYMAPVGLIQTSIEGEIALINPVSAQLLMPLSRDGSLTNLFTALESVAPEVCLLVKKFSEPSGMICDALRIQLSAGARGVADPQMLSLSLLKLDETRLMAVLSDISVQVSRERLLKRNEAWFNAIFTGITDYAMVSVNEQGCVDDWNESIQRVTGFTREGAIGQPYSLFYPEGAITCDGLIDHLHEADDDGWSQDEGWRMKADGSQFWGSGMMVPLHEHPGRAVDGLRPLVDGHPSYCLILRDITDKRAASELQRKAIWSDQLTGIANRRAFFEAAELEIERGKRSPRDLSLIMIDLDHFKQVNDTFGHPAGDAVLRHLAALMMLTFRLVDVVARIGGEEFAVLLPSTALDDAVAVAERLRRAVESKPVVVDGTPIRYTLSAGVAAMNSSLTGLDALIKQADLALFAAKEAGRNQVARSALPVAKPATPNDLVSRKDLV